MLLIPISISWI